MPRYLTILSIVLCPHAGVLGAQQPSRLFPPRSLIPALLAGPRDPVTSASLLGAIRNPNEHGRGVEAELSIGSSLPIVLLGGSEEKNPVVLGLEAVAFARFGLQVLERELVATDWIFAVPIVWHRRNGWTRFRFYHSSSHIGDEYSRRFGDPGVNFSRDALEILSYSLVRPALGAWAGARFGYNIKPEDDKRWVLRAGAQLEGQSVSAPLVPFLAADLELDQEAGFRPRVEVRVGSWLPEVGSRRAIRFSLVVLNGPTPLGQFRFRPTTQIGLSLQGSF